MATRRRPYIDLPDHARRDFIKWTLGLGAALGLKPWNVFEVAESVVGPAVAQSASSSPVNRYVCNVMGNGGFAWMTQLWPHVEIATKAGASFYATGQATDQLVDAAKGDHVLKIGPDAPKFGGKKMTAFMAGTNETHTRNPQTAANVAAGVRLFAAAAAIQTASPTLVPSISVGTLPYGTAAGAPAIAAVPNPAGIVGLFNSAASTAGGALVNAQDAALFEAYYKANLSLVAAANRPTFGPGLRTAKVSANLLGKNLANQLAPTPTDLARYGITAGTPAKLSSIANTLIATVKAFSLNLTSMVMQPGMNDDPHGAFTNMTTLAQTVQGLGRIWDAFYADLAATPDPMAAGRTLADSVIITWNGDTPKNVQNPSGWGDGTTSNSNWMYVLGQGYTKAGWFGQITAGNQVEIFNPSTGANMAGGAGSTGTTAAPASAAVLFAIAKGDMGRVADFYRGAPIDGIVNTALQ